MNKYRFSHLPLTEGKPIGKASVWEPERSMFKIMSWKTILYFYINVYYSFKAYYSQTWMFGIRTNEEEIMWTHLSLFLLIISDSPPATQL